MARKALLIALVIVVIFGAYWLSGYFIAYTDDAYVDTDLVMLATDVSGTVISVPVSDNQQVSKGELLAIVDPEPYRLALRQSVADLEAEKSKLLLLDKKYKLAKQNVEAEQESGSKGDIRKKSLALLDEAKQALDTQQKHIDAAGAAVDKARYDLKQTNVLSPVDGYVTGLRLHAGDYARQGQEILALVSQTGWHIKANYREQFIRHIKPGQKVLIYLDSYPWHFFYGHVRSIAYGISRQPEQAKVLPYVQPTTNWIRLSRRFPVTIELGELPPDIVLRRGADVRTLVIY